jgi:arylamine N-acetyltransferase
MAVILPDGPRTSQDPELSGLLTVEHAHGFLRWLDLPAEAPSVDALGRLISRYLGRVPFQNVTMLARPRRAPTLDEIVDDALSGRGGPCGVMNPFMAALLHRLGYDVCLLSGSMQEPDCHIALEVRIEKQRWWLDVGNGHPYLELVRLGDEVPRTYAGLTWRVRRLETECFAVEHLFPEAADWKTSYTFTTAPRPFSFFAGMIEAHYTRPGFGPFLLGLRLIRYPQGHMDALRDRIRLNGAGPVTRKELPDREAILEAAQQIAGGVELPLERALHALEQAGIRYPRKGEAA